MGLDLRWPIGMMFSLIGALMAITGLITHSQGDTYKRSLGINIDLWWGLFLIVFGVFMLFLAWRAAKRDRAERQQRNADQTGSGQRTSQQ